MQTAGSVDHPLPQQSDAGGWGRATCRQGRVTDERSVVMGRVMSQRVGGTSRGWDVVPYVR